MNSVDGNELGQERCRELHCRSVNALNNYLSDRATVVAQIPLCRNIEMKFKSFHATGLPIKASVAVQLFLQPDLDEGLVGHVACIGSDLDRVQQMLRQTQ